MLGYDIYALLLRRTVYRLEESSRSKVESRTAPDREPENQSCLVILIRRDEGQHVNIKDTRENKVGPFAMGPAGFFFIDI